MTKDNNKGVKSIAYNHLNLPTKVQLNHGGEVLYTYDAAGLKLKKEVFQSLSDPFCPAPNLTSYYAGNYIYEKNSSREFLQFFSHPKGNAEKNGSSYDYVYQYKDHLGNIRLLYADADNNGIIDASSEIISEKNYYPFGLEHKGYNNLIQNSNSTASKFKYNGKELNDELGLDWYDYGARNYDASLGRWMNVDPLADISDNISHSTYTYVWNNPISNIDPDGRTGQTTIVSAKEDGTYVVKDWVDDGSTDVVLEDGTKVGESLTTHSFVDDFGEAVVGAVIDPSDTSGQQFIDDEIIAADPNILYYMLNATGGEHYDFKDRGLDDAVKDGLDPIQHRYRGSMASNGKFGSARDFGNGAAGLVAGRAGLSYGESRVGFDGLETIQKSRIVPIGGKPMPVIIPSFEAKPTRLAQQLGWQIGNSMYERAAAARRAAFQKLKRENPEMVYPRGPKY